MTSTGTHRISITRYRNSGGPDYDNGYGKSAVNLRRVGGELIFLNRYSNWPRFRGHQTICSKSYAKPMMVTAGS
jgi:hypothetical protein